MATAALDGVGRPPAATIARDGFPWRRLLLVWLAVSAVLVVRFWHAIVTQDYADADDLMRLLEVRDLLGGQSWFDLTQYRLDPPVGLHSHWSRLVDLPLIALIAPLTPLVGRAMAETIASTVVPLATLGLTMTAMLVVVRRTVGRDPLFILLVPVMTVTAPAILMQMFPTRIDHHGWQICLSAIALAALLGGSPRRSGLVAGTAIALLMLISLEGLPFAVAISGALALLWAFDREQAERLTAFLAALAVVSIASFVVTAPTLRWSTGLCDVVKPAHLAIFAFAAAAMALAVRVTRRHGSVARLAALAIVGIGAAGLFGWLAPNCLGSPFGAMDPLVHLYWYENVLEGLPVTRQPIDGILSVLVFPLIGLGGAVFALRGAGDPEERRRWLLVMLIGAASLVAGAMVRRSAGVSCAVAIPGALVLIQLLRPRIEAVKRPVLRVPLTALMMIALTPLMPSWVGAMVTPANTVSNHTASAESACDWRCGVAAIGRLPAATMFTEIDVAPRLIEATHHRAYAGGYHRLEVPLHRTIAAFLGSPATARSIICGHGFDYVLIGPDSDESHIYRKANPAGFLARLLNGQVPAWLQRVPLPTRDLRLYRIVPGAKCQG